MAGMAWVKLHTDILGDPKLMRAARKGARGLELLPWVLAFAAAADDDGRLTVDGDAAEPEDIAHGIPGVLPTAVADCLASLTAIGVLAPDDDGALAFAAWQRRAMKPSDTPDAARARKQRSRAAHKDVTPCHAGQGVTVSRGGHATEGEGEGEGDAEKEAEPTRAESAAVDRERLAERLGMGGEQIVAAFIAACPPEQAWPGWVTAALVKLDGLGGAVPVPAPVMRRAIVAFTEKAKRWSVSSFEAFLATAASERDPPSLTGRLGRPRGGHRLSRAESNADYSKPTTDLSKVVWQK